MHRRNTVWLGPLLCLFSSGLSARAQAGTAQASQGGGGLVFEATAIAGGGRARAKSRYEPFDPGLPDEREDESSSSYNVAIELSLGKQLGPPALRVSGFVRVGRVATPDPVTAERSVDLFYMLGPRVTISPLSLGNVYITAAGGLAGIEGYGWGLGLGAGYRRPLRKRWSLGLGVEASGLWVGSDEDGDHGTYYYDDRVLGVNLMATARWQ